MKNLTLLLAVFSFLAADAVSAGPIKPLHGGFTESLGSVGSATDIFQFNCVAFAGKTINQALVRIKDKAAQTTPPPSDTVADQKPVLNVQIAPYTGVACGAFGVAVQDKYYVGPPNPPTDQPTPDGNLVFSPWTTPIAMPATGGKYCVKIFKTPGNQNVNSGATTNVGIERYEIDHHCEQAGSGISHSASTLGVTIQNQ